MYNDQILLKNRINDQIHKPTRQAHPLLICSSFTICRVTNIYDPKVVPTYVCGHEIKVYRSNLLQTFIDVSITDCVKIPVMIIYKKKYLTKLIFSAYV
jgi:hypothetical protein